MTVIQQDPTLFNASLRFNCDPTLTVHSSKIESLLKEAGLDSVLARGGVDMQITEEGGNLSAGEKQLVCIIRAILR